MGQEGGDAAPGGDCGGVGGGATTVGRCGGRRGWAGSSWVSGTAPKRDRV
jgi:hypothetical protein